MARQERVVIGMDGGSAQRVNTLITQQIGCGKNSDMPFNNNSASAIAFAGLLRPYGLICRELMRTATTDDDADVQCVVMSGQVERCPRFGTHPVSGESLGEHERLEQLAKLQKYIEEHINLRSDINLYSLNE